MEQALFSRRTKIGLLITFAVLALMYLLRDVVIPVAFSLLLAYFLDPLIGTIEKKKIGRTWAILLVMGVLTVIGVVFVLLVVPLIFDEFRGFVVRLPGLLQTAADRIIPLLQQWTGMELETMLDGFLSSSMQWIYTLKAQDLQPVTNVLKEAFTGTYSFIMALVSLALIPLFTFYFLRDFAQIKADVFGLIPPRHRETVHLLTGRIDDTLSSFVRGQVTVCLILMALYGAGYTISGVPLGFLIGIIAGGLAFIPYVGAGTGLILSLLMVLLDWQGWGPLVGLGITFGIVSNVESFILTPNIVGDKVGLKPVQVILALLIGAELFGFAGVLIAVPTAAVLRILWHYTLESYTESEFYTDDSAGETHEADPTGSL